MIEIVGIGTRSLGDRSYLATDSTAALVVDPQRDIDRVLVVAAAAGGPAAQKLPNPCVGSTFVLSGSAAASRRAETC